MKNRQNNLIIVLALIFILFNLSIISNASSADFRLENLDINVYLNEDGSAKITEKRKATYQAGTENFILIENLGKSEIKDFTVSENGMVFQYEDDWDINASREEKIGKNGIITKSDGYELVWGIGEYGSHDYTLEYTVTNFVKGLEDSQMVFWKFLERNTNIPPENARVVIESKDPFSSEDERIWAFGFAGNIEFQEGKIVAVSSEALSDSDYITILTKFPQGMFKTEDIIDSNFEDIKEQAFVGSDYGDSDRDEGAYESGGDVDNVFGSRSPWGIGSVIMFFAVPIIFIGGFISVIIALIVASNSKLTNKSPNKFKRKYKEEYYRDFPYEGNFLDIYYIPFIMGTANFENLLTGFILKWINEDKIKTVEEEVGWIFKKDQTNLKFLNKNIPEDSLEGELFSMMLSAAGANEILEENEFTKWAKSNISKIDNWEKKVKKNSIEKLKALGYIDVIEKKVLFFKSEKYELTQKGKELEENIYKYINYLYDFSLLNEHQAVNVRIWDNIMVWAGFLGLTEEVSAQFEKLYPNYSQETVYTGNTIFLTHHLARNISQGRVSASSTGSSGGFGGGSSMGGGGGSFGGGGGGVR